MAKRKKSNTLLIVGAAVVGYYLYMQWKKKQPQTKPADKRFIPGGMMLENAQIVESTTSTNANGNLKNPPSRMDELPEFPYSVRVKSISGLKLM